MARNFFWSRGRTRRYTSVTLVFGIIRVTEPRMKNAVDGHQWDHLSVPLSTLHPERITSVLKKKTRLIQSCKVAEKNQTSLTILGENTIWCAHESANKFNYLHIKTTATMKDFLDFFSSAMKWHPTRRHADRTGLLTTTLLLSLLRSVSVNFRPIVDKLEALLSHLADAGLRAGGMWHRWGRREGWGWRIECDWCSGTRDQLQTPLSHLNCGTLTVEGCGASKDAKDRVRHKRC